MRKISCVFCESTHTELFSLFGQTLLGSQYYCNDCKSIFEAVRFEEDESTQIQEVPPLGKGSTSPRPKK